MRPKLRIIIVLFIFISLSIISYIWNNSDKIYFRYMMIKVSLKIRLLESSFLIENNQKNISSFMSMYVLIALRILIHKSFRLGCLDSIHLRFILSRKKISHRETWLVRLHLIALFNSLEIIDSIVNYFKDTAFFIVSSCRLDTLRFFQRIRSLRGIFCFGGWYLRGFFYGLNWFFFGGFFGFENSGLTFSWNQASRLKFFIILFWERNINLRIFLDMILLVILQQLFSDSLNSKYEWYFS